MQSGHPVLYLLHADARLRARLGQEPGSSFRVHELSGWSELREALRRCSPDAAVLVDPHAHADQDRGPSPRLRELLREFPSSPVIAAFEVTNDRIDDMRVLMSWGIAEILDTGRELTWPAILRRLDSARGHRMRLVLRYDLPQSLPSRTRAVLAVAAEVVAAGGKAQELAKRLQTGERTLNRWCSKVDLPEPRRLLSWLRLLLAADMLSEGDRTVAAVARACGYASDSSLRNALRLVARTTPADVKARGVMQSVATPFCAELSELRDRADAVSRARTYLN